MDQVDSTDDALFAIDEDCNRRCGVCGVVRPLDMFYVAAEQRRSLKRGGVRALVPCRVCTRNKNRARLSARYELAAKIKVEAGCADCGIRDLEHPEIYDFDHLPGFVKIAAVSAFFTKGTVEDMLAEIAKCEVVCANCHRIRTQRQRGGWASFGQDRGPEPDRTFETGAVS